MGEIYTAPSDNSVNISLQLEKKENIVVLKTLIPGAVQAVCRRGIHGGLGAPERVHAGAAVVRVVHAACGGGVSFFACAAHCLAARGDTAAGECREGAPEGGVCVRPGVVEGRIA